MQQILQPFPLEGTKNTRELGGYHNDTGQLLKSHSLLRSDALHQITPEDACFLSNYGVCCVIDLRFSEERIRFPDRIGFFPSNVEYIPVSLQDPVRQKRYIEEFPSSMWELYCWMLDDSQVEFKQIFEAIARFTQGAVLFHCTGGKDRTGMVAMLLLKLAGVDDETIIGDYTLTESVMKELFVLQTKELESRGLVVPQHIMQSPPFNMEKALIYLSQQYGTAADYMAHIGLNLQVVQAIRQKMLG